MTTSFFFLSGILEYTHKYTNLKGLNFLYIGFY